MFASTLDKSRQAFIKFGYAGLLFFTIKGLLWLLMPLLFAWYIQ